jgi:1-acyl-sn-glycerol-3-phosphate acyltransferase
LIYPLIKILVRLALKIFCSDITVLGAERTGIKGPVLIVSNHPNSFLDAIIIAARFREKIHFLARGDAFVKPTHRKLLGLLNMIPVYRLSEGKENLRLNEEAFRQVNQILANKGIVLIFIEGICLQTHRLQPFKKGAARIAWANRDTPGFSVLPLGIAYDSFTRFGKKIVISVGEPLQTETLFGPGEEAKNLRLFNERLFGEINQRIHLPEKRRQEKKNQGFFFLPALLGYMLHLPLFRFVQNPVLKKTGGSVFYDSVLFASLLLVYPTYLFVLGLLLFFLQCPAAVLLFILILHPLTAFCAVHYYPKNNNE